MLNIYYTLRNHGINPEDTIFSNTKYEELIQYIAERIPVHTTLHKIETKDMTIDTIKDIIDRKINYENEDKYLFLLESDIMVNSKSAITVRQFYLNRIKAAKEAFPNKLFFISNLELTDMCGSKSYHNRFAEFVLPGTIFGSKEEILTNSRFSELEDKKDYIVKSSFTSGSRGIRVDNGRNIKTTFNRKPNNHYTIQPLLENYGEFRFLCINGQIKYTFISDLFGASIETPQVMITVDTLQNCKTTIIRLLNETYVGDYGDTIEQYLRNFTKAFKLTKRIIANFEIPPIYMRVDIIHVRDDVYLNEIEPFASGKFLFSMDFCNPPSNERVQQHINYIFGTVIKSKLQQMYPGMEIPIPVENRPEINYNSFDDSGIRLAVHKRSGETGKICRGYEPQCIEDEAVCGEDNICRLPDDIPTPVMEGPAVNTAELRRTLGSLSAAAGVMTGGSYSKITNPKTGRKVGIHTKLGQSILKKYLRFL
jgi:hypothetical protein